MVPLSIEPLVNRLTLTMELQLTKVQSRELIAIKNLFQMMLTEPLPIIQGARLPVNHMRGRHLINLVPAQLTKVQVRGLKNPQIPGLPILQLSQVMRARKLIVVVRLDLLNLRVSQVLRKQDKNQRQAKACLLFWQLFRYNYPVLN